MKTVSQTKGMQASPHNHLRFGVGRANARASAPFKRNDTMLETLPAGVIILPGGGIQDNFHDKAKAMGIRCWDFRKRGGA